MSSHVRKSENFTAKLTVGIHINTRESAGDPLPPQVAYRKDEYSWKRSLGYNLP